ncbi:hypothetical protein UlMin_026871 [Ulmus minor]
MPLKRASASRSSAQPESEHEISQKFVNAKARKRFELEVKERKIHEEKGFILKSGKDFGLPPEVAVTICTHNWKAFATHPSNPVLPMVREFYANIVSGNQPFSMVRGVKVSFSAPSINMHFDLEDCVDNFNALLESVRGVELDRVLQSVTVEGTTWMPNRGEGIFMCARPTLRPIAKIWYHFIRTRLMPTTHIETVNRERLLLLHCILEGKSINVGGIIQKEISACAFKPKGCLFFSLLITELCLRAGVDINSSNEVLPNTAAISTMAIKRFFHSNSKHPQEQVPPPSQVGNSLLAIQQLMDIVKHNLVQQQKFWAFVKDTHVWTKRMFKLNLPKKLMNSPKFPDEILLPYVPTTLDQATPSQVLSPTDQS